MPLSKFAGNFNAADYAYGINPEVAPLLVDVGVSTTGSGSITLAFGTISLADGTVVAPLSTNAPISIGNGAGANYETQTPTAVTNPSPGIYNTAIVTATWTYTHGSGETVSSGTVGLQEAINACNAYGGGVVVVSARWASLGGTSAMIAAAVLPANNSVTIEDNRGGSTTAVTYSADRPTGALITAPVAATSATVASLTGAGTWTSGTVHVLFTYVTAVGGETLASADYTFSATASVAIGGSGPAAETDAVGYRVYISTVGGPTSYLCPVTAANGSVLQCGPIQAFKIGTSFSIATAVTSALALVPGVSTAFGTIQSVASLVPPQDFQTTWPPMSNIGAINAAATGTLGQIQLPTGFLNVLGRTIRLKGNIAATTNGTPGTLTTNVLLHSVYGTTSITPFTAVSGTTTGSAVVSCDFECIMSVSKTGASGTVECHGQVAYSLAGTAVATMAMDFIHAASSTVDLTKQDCLEVTMTCTTTATTATTLRQLTVELLA